MQDQQSGIPLDDLIDLVALYRTSWSDVRNHFYLDYSDQTGFGLTSCREADRTVLTKLYERGYIAPSPEYCLPSGLSTYPPEDIVWLLNPGFEHGPPKVLVDTLEHPVFEMGVFTQQRQEEVKSTWIRLALEDILAHLESALTAHEYVLRAGPKTEAVFSQILDHFSTYQAFNYIWHAVEKASAYQRRTRISNRRAANTVITICQTRVDRAICEGWEIKAYRRNYKIRRSMRIHIFANVVTALGERFYSARPSISALLEQ